MFIVVVHLLCILINNNQSNHSIQLFFQQKKTIISYNKSSVNQSINQLIMSIHVNPLLNVKDSRWLQLEVCREFQRNKCTRSDSECKFAHPGPNVEIQNGRVIACYDSIKVSDKN